MKKKSSRLEEINATIPASGCFTAKDKQGTPVIIDWQKTTLFAPEFTAMMREVWPIAREAYTPTELDFLRAFPQVVGTEDYYKIFEPLFKNGVASVDWSEVEKVVQESLKPHFIYDTSTWGPEVLDQFSKDVCYAVTIKNQKANTLRGFGTFMVRATYAPGDIKMMTFAVDPSHQNRGLGKLLMCSILKINPNIKRISLHTRVTNDKGLKIYVAWGFTKDEQPILDYPTNHEHWIFLKYKTDQVDTLQKTAETLIMVK